MFDWAYKAFANAYVRRRLAKEPAVIMARDAIFADWTNNPNVVKNVSTHDIERIQTALMQEVIHVTVSDDPYLKSRIRLSAAVCELAKYQVLVVSGQDGKIVEPAWLQDVPGVSGQLKDVLLELVGKLEWLQEMLNLGSALTVWDQVWAGVIFHYLVSLARSNVHARLRRIWDNAAPISETQDWLLPFMKAMSIWAEYNIRHEAGLPNMLSAIDALEYSVFMNLVSNGVEDPGKDWKEAYPEKAESIWR